MAGELSKTLWRIVLPVLFGVGMGVWLVRRDIDIETLRSINLDWRGAIGIALALLFVVGRDFGLAWRFHTIAAGDLTWRRAVRTDIMCAFTSAITPSVVGGSALAIFYLNREGISLGRATTLTLTTLFLDELFFVIFCPLIALFVPMADLFAPGAMAGNGTDMFFGGVEVVFWLVYAGIVIWTAILFFAIIAKPQATQRVIGSLARRRFLKRFRAKLETVAGNMVATSKWVKGRSRKWWINVFGATVLSWFSRYFVVCALFFAFVPDVSQILVFARQFVVWVVLMVSPTPGGSGISEWLFTNYYGDLIGNLGVAAILAIVWRILSYYIYLIAGCTLLPGYFGNKSNK